MRLKAFLVIFASVGLWSCNKDREPAFKAEPHPAPIIGYSVVNPPMVDTARVRGGQTLAELRMIPLGSTIQIRNNEAISLETADLGQTFPGTVARDVLDSKGLVAIPKGAEATLVVLHIGEKGERVLDIGGVAVAGRRFGLEALKHGGASARTGHIAASTLMSFQLEGPAQIRELR